MTASCSANWRPIDAGSRTGSERLEQGRGTVPRAGGREPVRIEEFDVVAPLRLTVQRPGEHGDGLTLVDRVLPPDHGVGESHSIEVGHRR